MKKLDPRDKLTIRTALKILEVATKALAKDNKKKTTVLNCVKRARKTINAM